MYLDMVLDNNRMIRRIKKEAGLYEKTSLLLS